MRVVLGFCLLWSLWACTEERIPIPKPRVYPKVNYPERQYTRLDKTYCNFNFEYPDYMQFEQDTTLGNQLAKHPCWFVLQMPALNGSIHFTYTDISGSGETENRLFDIIQDSYNLTEKHNIKANGRDETPFADRSRKFYGIIYEVDGDVASPYHCIVTDSVQHAVWASLYFNSLPNADSMAPVVAYVQEDLDRILETFQWNDQPISE